MFILELAQPFLNTVFLLSRTGKTSNALFKKKLFSRQIQTIIATKYYYFHFTGFRFAKTCQRSFQVAVINTMCFNPKIDVDPIDLKNALKITVFEPTKMAHIQKVLKWNIKKFRKLESLTFSCEVCLVGWTWSERITTNV